MFKEKYMFITPSNYPKFFKILKKKLNGIEIPKIKVNKDDKHVWVKSSFYSRSILFTERSWKILSFNEKVAVTLHEIGHFESKIQWFYVFPFIFLFLASLVIKNIVSSLMFAILLEFIIFRSIFWWFISLISVRDEIFADKFSIERINKKHLISALDKFSKEKIPPLKNILYYTFIFPFKIHPSIKERKELLS